MISPVDVLAGVGVAAIGLPVLLLRRPKITTTVSDRPQFPPGGPQWPGPAGWTGPRPPMPQYVVQPRRPRRRHSLRLLTLATVVWAGWTALTVAARHYHGGQYHLAPPPGKVNVALIVIWVLYVLGRLLFRRRREGELR